jgi:hypothetical protein
MPELSIKDFSCISTASIEVKRLNVIIGPQGSGKSVVTKLIFFFCDLLPGLMRAAEDGLSITEQKKQIEKMFSVWFPPQAWGNKRFLINFSDGNFQCRIMRRQIAKSLSDEVRVSLSPWAEQLYHRSLDAFSKVRSDDEVFITPDDLSAHGELERAWRVRERVRAEIEQQTSGYATFNQTFIPAGRAFFTSIGRLVAGIEHAGSLDPATLKFARVFANWRDRSGLIFSKSDVSGLQELRKSTMLDLFKGVVQNKRNAEFIEMDDGRKVPFSSLSSGQQELLPIWYFLDNLITFDAVRDARSSKGNKPERHIVYIEEPEAHLFPKSQAILLDTLVSLVLGTPSGVQRKLVITTHSPYLMARLNVLLKAGQLAKRKRKLREITEIVSKNAWLKLEDVSVQSINNGILNSIVDSNEGLVDAHFLDSISDSISIDFSSLLDIEENL